MFRGQDPNGYEFSARPKVVETRPKFRDPYGQTYEYIPQNIMHDRRIARGSTHASMVIPAGNHPDALFLEKKKEQQRRAKLKQEEEARKAAEEYARRDIKTPEPLPGRVNLPVQTEPFVENLTDKPTEFEIGVQSDFYIDRPPTPLFVPQKIGEDAQTQVEKNVFDEDVYDFDDIVEPILSVMCHNLLEQAQMEVYEEHEFNVVDSRRKDFEKVRNLKLIEAQRLEAADTRRKQEIERRKNQVKARTIHKVNAHQKYTSRQIAKKYLTNVCPIALQLLEDQGTLVESLGVLLHEQAVPWLLEQTMKFLKDDIVIDDNAEEIVEESLNYPTKAHHETVEQDNNRRRQQEKEQEERRIAKEQRRRKREEAAEKARKIAELNKLKDEIYSEFVEAGEVKDKMIAQEITDYDGNYQAMGVMGVYGGHLTQIGIVISTASKLYNEKVKNFLTRDQMTRFFATYLSQNMKCDNLYLKMNKKVEQYIKEKEINMNAMQKCKEDKKAPFIEFLLNPADCMINESMRSFVNNAEDFGLDHEPFVLLNRALVDIITKSPPAKDGVLAKLDPLIEKIKLTPPPEGYDPENQNIKAIVRIRIPMEEAKDEEEQKSTDKSMDKDKKKGKKGKEDLNKSKELNKSKDLNKSDLKEEAKAEDGKPKEVEMREVELEDRVLLVNPKGEKHNVYVLHQGGARMLRKDIIAALVKNVPDFADIDAEELAAKSELISNELEASWIASLSHIPVFDYDFN